MEDSWMGLNQFLQDVSCELQEILWRDVPREPNGRELDRLERDLHRASLALTPLRTSVAELRSRLAEKERRARWLEARVEMYLHVADRVSAWRHALELDQLRHALDQDRARLLRRRQAYHAQLARVRQIQQRLDDLHFEIYSKG
jgi:uncharacterized protein YhaN